MSVTGAEACVWASISTERVTGNHDERASVGAKHRNSAIAIRPQKAFRSPENPKATLDTLAAPADDWRHY